MQDKSAAAGSLLLIQALLMAVLSLLTGLGLGLVAVALGLQLNGGTPADPTGLAVLAFVALAQGTLMLISMLASGFGLYAAARALRGDPSLTRAGAMLCLGTCVLNGLASLLSLSCCWATFWSVPGVLGVIAVALALEAAAEAPVREAW